MSKRNTGDNLGVTEVVGPNLDTSVPISGQITIVAAGTAVQGPDVELTNGAYIRFMASNSSSSYGYEGGNGAADVDSGNGYEFSPGDQIPVNVENMNELWFDASVSGSKFCWHKA